MHSYKKSFPSICRRATWIACLCVCYAASAFAQPPALYRRPQGREWSVLVGAQVTRCTSRRITRTTVSTDEGRFVFREWPSARMKSVRAERLQAARAQRRESDVGETVVLSLVMEYSLGAT